MNLRTLLERVPHRVLCGPVDREVTAVCRDSRRAEGDGWIFVAVKGASVDGHRFIPTVDAGVVVVEQDMEAAPGVTVVSVEDTRTVLGLLAAGLAGDPSHQLPVVGVTGTNGKTTITTVLEQALASLGHRSLRVGTTGISLGGQSDDLGFTTPEAPDLQNWLERSRGAGAYAALLEVSSIGLAQRRVDGVAFHTAVFTNLTADHLDFHGTMEVYAAEKARLFQELLREKGGKPRALLCRDDASWRSMGVPDDHWTYGEHEEADLRITDVQTDIEGTSFTLTTPQGCERVSSSLIGDFNALNVVAAVGCLLTLGVGLSDAVAAVGRVAGVPGRLERVDTGGRATVFVDYAHSPDALERVLGVLRGLTPGALWVVFGCGGDRDRLKRPMMGRVARADADQVVLTTDNPRCEDPMAIIRDVLEGCADGEGAHVHVEVDRTLGIRWALDHAAPGDVVLIAGKGHETYQEVEGARLPFDDRRVVTEWVEGRHAAS